MSGKGSCEVVSRVQPTEVEVSSFRTGSVPSGILIVDDVFELLVKECGQKSAEGSAGSMCCIVYAASEHLGYIRVAGDWIFDKLKEM